LIIYSKKLYRIIGSQVKISVNLNIPHVLVHAVPFALLNLRDH